MSQQLSDVLAKKSGSDTDGFQTMNPDDFGDLHNSYMGHIRIKINLTDKFSLLERFESKRTVESNCSSSICM